MASASNASEKHRDNARRCRTCRQPIPHIYDPFDTHSTWLECIEALRAALARVEAQTLERAARYHDREAAARHREGDEIGRNVHLFHAQSIRALAPEPSGGDARHECDNSCGGPAVREGTRARDGEGTRRPRESADGGGR